MNFMSDSLKTMSYFAMWKHTKYKFEWNYKSIISNLISQKEISTIICRGESRDYLRLPYPLFIRQMKKLHQRQTMTFPHQWFINGRVWAQTQVSIHNLSPHQPAFFILSRKSFELLDPAMPAVNHPALDFSITSTSKPFPSPLFS